MSMFVWNNRNNNKETKSLIKVELVKSPVFELAARKESANNKRNLNDSEEKKKSLPSFVLIPQERSEVCPFGHSLRPWGEHSC